MKQKVKLGCAQVKKVVDSPDMYKCMGTHAQATHVQRSMHGNGRMQSRQCQLCAHQLSAEWLQFAATKICVFHVLFVGHKNHERFLPMKVMYFMASINLTFCLPDLSVMDRWKITQTRIFANPPPSFSAYSVSYWHCTTCCSLTKSVKLCRTFKPLMCQS